MNFPDEEDRLHYVREKTRRVVGRVVLRRASNIVQGWRAAERDNVRIAKQSCAGLLALALTGAAVLILI